MDAPDFGLGKSSHFRQINLIWFQQNFWPDLSPQA